MDRKKDLREMGVALIAGTGYTDAQVPNMKQVTFWGTHGDVGLWGEFMTELIGIAGNDSHVARITKIMRRVDALAEEKKELVLGRLKNEIKDLSGGEAMFIVSYLYVAYGIAATPDETAPEPPPAAAPVKIVPAAGPRVAVASAPADAGAAKKGGAGPQDDAPGPRVAVPPARVTGPLVDLDALVPPASAPSAAPAEDAPAPKPDAGRAASVFTRKPMTETELAAERARAHGHGDDHGSHEGPPAPPADTKGILKVVVWGMIGLVVTCTGSIGFLYWLFT